MRSAVLALVCVVWGTSPTHEIIIVRPGDVPAMRRFCTEYLRWERMTHDRVEGMFDRCASIMEP